MSAIGPSRHFAAMQCFNRFQGEADIEPFRSPDCRLSSGLRQHAASCSGVIGSTRCASAASIFSRSRLVRPLYLKDREPLLLAVNRVGWAFALDRDATFVAAQHGGMSQTWLARYLQGCGVIAHGLRRDRVRVF
jgi:hypothetical protein